MLILSIIFYKKEILRKYWLNGRVGAKKQRLFCSAVFFVVVVKASSSIYKSYRPESENLNRGAYCTL